VLDRVLSNLLVNAFRYGKPPVVLSATGATAICGSPSRTRARACRSSSCCGSSRDRGARFELLIPANG